MPVRLEATNLHSMTIQFSLLEARAPERIFPECRSRAVARDCRIGSSIPTVPPKLLLQTDVPTKADGSPSMRRIFFQYLQVVAVTVVSLSLGCSKPQTLKVSVPPPPELPRTSSAPPLIAAAKLSPTEENLHHLGREMEALISQPAFAVPDAVLNRTACLIAFPFT